MKSYTKILVALLFVSTLYSFNASIVPDSKVGYIDASMVRELPEYKAVYAELEELKEIEQTKYLQRSDEFERLRAQLEKVQDEISKEELAKRIAELTTMKDEILSMEVKSMDFLTKQETIMLQPFLDKVDKKIEAIAIEKGYTLVLDGSGNVLYVEGNHDLTNALKMSL